MQYYEVKEREWELYYAWQLDISILVTKNKELFKFWSNRFQIQTSLFIEKKNYNVIHLPHYAK
jgi:hypothetical protein